MGYDCLAQQERCRIYTLFTLVYGILLALTKTQLGEGRRLRGYIRVWRLFEILLWL